MFCVRLAGVCACFFGHAIHSFAFWASVAAIFGMRFSRVFWVLVNSMVRFACLLVFVSIVTFLGSVPRVFVKSCGGLIRASCVFGLMPSFFASGVSLYGSNMLLGTTVTFDECATACFSAAWICL